MFTGRSTRYLFIFFAGLLVYLFNIDHMVVCWVALLTTVNMHSFVNGKILNKCPINLKFIHYLYLENFSI
jgi:hypothetical protein